MVNIGDIVSIRGKVVKVKGQRAVLNIEGIRVGVDVSVITLDGDKIGFNAKEVPAGEPHKRTPHKRKDGDK